VSAWVKRIVTVKVTTGFDTAMFYLFATYLLGLTITWPIVFAVAWAVDTAYGVEYSRAHRTPSIFTEGRKR
jgi:hypothetical protein